MHYCALVFLLSGCIDDFEADIPAEDTDLLAVEGTISSSAQCTFILSRTRPVNSTDAPQMVTDATVSVRGSDGSEYAALAADGHYTCQTGQLSPDVEYYLHIESDGEVYESVPQKPLPTETIADIRGVQSTPESQIDVLVTPSQPLEPGRANYYTWTYDETWEVHPDYFTNLFFNIVTLKPDTIPGLFPERGWKDGRSQTVFIGASTNYDQQQIRGLKLYDIDRSNERIYHTYSALVRQRAITKTEYEYELARRQADAEMGGLFTPQPSALPTNMRCLTSDKRAIGYVGCSLNTSERRFFLHRADFSVAGPPLGYRVVLDDCNEEECRRMVWSGLFLVEWDDRREDQANIDGGKLRTVWALEPQLNVRSRGAYTKKPDFWED